LNISGIIRNVLNDLQASEPKTLELKVGEVVKGMVFKLLSDTDAIINIGGVQVTAKLETPLKQGEVTLLQVQPQNSSGQVVLKPLGASVVQIAEGSLAEVLKNVGLPDSPINRQIIQTMHQSGVALSKENVQAFAQLQSQIPASVAQEEWIPSAVVAFQKGIPLTSETVTAVRQAITGPAFHETLKQLDAQMTKLLTDHPTLSASTKSAIDIFKGVVALVKEASSELVPQAASQLSDSEVENLLTITAGTGRQQNTTPADSAGGRSSALNNQLGSKALGTPASNASDGVNPPATAPAPSNGSTASVRASGTPLQGNPAAAAPAVTEAALSEAAEDGLNANAASVRASAAPLQGNQPAASLSVPTSVLNEAADGLNADAAKSVVPNAEQQASPSAPKTVAGQSQVQPPLTSSAQLTNASHITGGSETTAKAAIPQSIPTSSIPGAPSPSTASTDPLLKVSPTVIDNKQTDDHNSAAVQPRESASRTDHSQSAAREGPASALDSANNEEHWISKLIKAVGVEHENTIFKLPERMALDGQLQSKGGLLDADIQASNNPLQEQMKSVDTLKSALLMLVQSDDTPSSLKETVQQAIQQITGQQLLLNTDRTSMFSNITLFIPLINANGEQTAAIHIQSRKGARGEIDANNCHLVFDLRMKALGDTMIDVQVVDRIVSLRVLNDQPFIEQLLESHREEITASLSKIGYKFISLKCSPYPAVSQPAEDAAVGTGKADLNLSSQLQALYGNKSYKGVDVRI
jgi:hypothetical protein